MAAVEKSITISAPPDKIWVALKDPQGWGKWFEGASAPKSIDGNGDPGTIVEINMAVANIPLPTRLTVIETIPYDRWKGEFTSVGAQGHMLWSYMAMGPRTRLTFRIEANLIGPAKVIEGVVVKSFEEMADKTLLNIKSMVEG